MSLFSTLTHPKGRYHMNFALIGAAGYIAPRHMSAIHETGNTLIAATDPHDCVGRLDSYFPDCRFFTEIERFDRHLEKLRRRPEEQHVNYVSVCSPNYLHDAHIRLGMRIKADVICEKPIVLSPWNLDALQELEAEHEQKVYSILQLRLLSSLQKIKTSLENTTQQAKPEICLTYITRRGRWYDVSWKGAIEKSGGVSMNIGIHFFDLLLWIFGSCEKHELHLHHSRKMAGHLELERARVKWFLSTDETDLPRQSREEGKYAHRSLTLDGEEMEFSTGFTDLHTRMYKEILAGRGFGLEEARPAIELVHQINQTETCSAGENGHPLLENTQVLPIHRVRKSAA